MHNILIHYRPNRVGAKTVTLHLNLPLYEKDLNGLVRFIVKDIELGCTIVSQYGYFDYNNKKNIFVWQDSRKEKLLHHIKTKSSQPTAHRTVLTHAIRALVRPYITEGDIDLDEL